MAPTSALGAESRLRSVPVTGMRCAACAASVERLLRAVPGVAEATVNFATREARLRHAGDLATLRAALAAGGYDIATRRTLCAGVADEAALAALDGVLGTRPVAEGVEVTHLDLPEVLEALREAAGEAARLVPGAGGAPAAALAEARDARRRVLLGALPTLGLLLGAMEPGRSLLPAAVTGAWVQATLALVVLAVSGRPILGAALRGLLHRRVDMNTLVALGAGSAFALSLARTLAPPPGPLHLYYETTAVILELVLLGRWLEARARRRMGDALAALGRRAPETALLLAPGGGTRTVHPSRLLPGDRVRVLPGQGFPADGRVREGSSSADEALLTGESIPVPKAPGAPVHAGTLNGPGALEVEVTAAGAGTLLARITRQVASAQGSRAPVARLADRVAAVFVPLVLLLAGLAFGAWALWGGAGAAERGLVAGVSVLLIACPCALGLATPTALVVGLGRAAQQGILVRDGETLERAAQVGTVCLDKTGTLTRGRPELIHVEALDGRPEDLLRAVAAVEAGSEHPLAGAVLEAARARGLGVPAARASRTEPGRGVEGEVGGETVLAGSAGFLADRGVDLRPLQPLLAEADRRGATVLLVARGGRPLGGLLLRDEPRPEARAVLARLAALGVQVVLLSGDRAPAARAVAGELGIARCHAPLSPLEKGEWLQRHAAERPAMVGDGVNDAPALAGAWVGISVAGATDVAVGAAGVALLDAGLTRLPDALWLARRTLRTIRQNLFWAFAYNTVGIPVAALGWLDPMLAAGAMAASSLFVVGNSLRLARAGGAGAPPAPEGRA